MLSGSQVKELAHACGFELAGIAPALPLSDFHRYQKWRAAGYAAEMRYLTDHRGDLRSDPRNLLASAKSILCVGKLYNTEHPRTVADPERGWISRYAWATDYHDVLRSGLELFVQRLRDVHPEPFEWKICVDTAPLLERSYARSAGLGWIGRNTCLINQQQGSWFLLGAVLLSIPLAADAPPPDRCGSCTRCIDACPTDALVNDGLGNWTLDSSRCISYLTIEKRGDLPRQSAEAIGNMIFGCDICQDVCPWNSRAPSTQDKEFQPTIFAPLLHELAGMSEQEFKRRFRFSAIKRAKHSGFLRNIAAAIRNACIPMFLIALCGSLARADVPVRSPLKQAGFVHFYNNEYDQAIADFEAEVRSHPNDPDGHNHLAQSILFREMYRDGALESELVTGSNPFLRRPKMNIPPADKAQFLAEINEAIHLSSSALKQNPADTHGLYARVVSFGLRANFEFLVEKAWLSALHDATEARKADDRLLEIAPNFVDAHLAQGMSEYIVGNLPGYLRMLGAIRGFRGDKEDGLRQLERVARDGVLDRYDAQVFLAVIYRRDHQPDKAIPLLQHLAQTFPRNYLFRLEQVQMYSDLGDKQTALQILGDVDRLRTSGAPGYAQIPREKLRYLRGNLLFWYGDLDPALNDMRQVTQNSSDLDLNTAVMAWLRLGQIYDLRGQHVYAVGAYRQTASVAPKSDAALEAKGYISSPYHRKRNA